MKRPDTAEADVLIVGAGIVGAACAWQLSRAGLRVTVLDAAPALGCFPGATGAGMGHLLVVEDDPHLLALTSYGRELWRQLAPDLPADSQWSTSGTLWLAETEDELALADHKQRILRAAGVMAERVPARELFRLEPRLADDLAGGLRVPHDAIVYPPAATRWLLEQARDAGARLCFGVEVTSIEADAIHLRDGGRVHAPWLLCAAGLQALRLLPEPIAAELLPRKGHLVVTDGGGEPFCHHQLVELGYQKSVHGDAARSVAFNLQPRPDGQALVGSSRQYDDASSCAIDDHAVDRHPVDRRLVADMLRRALRFVPALAQARALRVWTGLRPAIFGAGKLPLIGPLPGHPSILLAAGHEGLGITTALVTGELLRDHILGRTPGIDATPFLPPAALPMREVAHA